MRRRIGVMVVGGLLGIAAPLSAAPLTDPEPAAAVPATAVIQHAARANDGLRDEMAMVLVGSALIGLAAAVRRSG